MELLGMHGRMLQVLWLFDATLLQPQIYGFTDRRRQPAMPLGALRISAGSLHNKMDK